MYSPYLLVDVYTLVSLSPPPLFNYYYTGGRSLSLGRSICSTNGTVNYACDAPYLSVMSYLVWPELRQYSEQLSYSLSLSLYLHSTLLSG